MAKKSAGSLDDLYVALSLVSSGLFESQGEAESFARRLRERGFVDGVKVSSGDLWESLKWKGKAIFAEKMEQVRAKLCRDGNPRPGLELTEAAVAVAIRTALDAMGHSGPAQEVIIAITVRIGVSKLCAEH